MWMLSPIASGSDKRPLILEACDHSPVIDR
jgi:hypothetical protein